MIDIQPDLNVVEAQESAVVISNDDLTVDVSLSDEQSILVIEEVNPILVIEESVMTLQVMDDLQSHIVEVVEKGPRGDRGEPGSTASLSSDSGQLATTGSDTGIYVSEQRVRDVAANQDSVVVFDYDALVLSTLGV